MRDVVGVGPGGGRVGTGRGQAQAPTAARRPHPSDGGRTCGIRAGRRRANDCRAGTLLNEDSSGRSAGSRRRTGGRGLQQFRWAGGGWRDVIARLAASVCTMKCSGTAEPIPRSTDSWLPTSKPAESFDVVADRQRPNRVFRRSITPRSDPNFQAIPSPGNRSMAPAASPARSPGVPLGGPSRGGRSGPPRQRTLCGNDRRPAQQATGLSHSGRRAMKSRYRIAPCLYAAQIRIAVSRRHGYDFVDRASTFGSGDPLLGVLLTRAMHRPHVRRTPAVRSSTVVISRPAA